MPVEAVQENSIKRKSERRSKTALFKGRFASESKGSEFL